MNGGLPGVKADQRHLLCYLPNAAIAWKQPNGFYYAPAFHSDNLFFDSVSIRHFVIEPFFKLGTFETDLDLTKKAYCYWSDQLFVNFTDIDRETVLNDDDGSLTGLTSQVNKSSMAQSESISLNTEDFFNVPVETPDIDLATGLKTETISLNTEDFFNAPVETPECASDLPLNDTGNAKLPPNTAKTSPYEHVTTAIYPECADSVPEAPGLRFCAGNTWGSDCTTADKSQYNSCIGIPIYRQLITTKEASLDPREQGKRLMGQATFQRSGLTVNHGSYYIDTTVSEQTQKDQGAKSVNVFTPGQKYDLFFLYSKPTTTQTYTMYVGDGFNKEADLKFGYVDITTKKYQFTEAPKPSSWKWKSDYTDGILTLTVNMSTIKDDMSSMKDDFDISKPDGKPYGDELCQPHTMCSRSTTAKKCQCNITDKNNYLYDLCHEKNAKGDDAICSWSVKDLDCPAKGCPGVQITFPDSAHFKPDDKNRRPNPANFANDPTGYNWKVSFNNEEASISGEQCHYNPTDLP